MAECNRNANPNANPKDQAHSEGQRVTRTECIRHDIYRGTEAGLVAAGLMEPHQAPGRTCAGRTVTSHERHGTRVPRGASRAAQAPGYKQVSKSGQELVVTVRVSIDEAIRREAMHRAAWKIDNEARMQAWAWRAMLDVIKRVSDQ